jgi:hypothetical protein
MTTSIDRRSRCFSLGEILARPRCVSCIYHNLLYYYVCMYYEAGKEALGTYAAWVERPSVL